MFLSIHVYINQSYLQKPLSYSKTIGPVLASEDKLDQTKLINLAMYNPFNILNFGTGLIVFDWLIGANDGLLQNLTHSFLVGNSHLANHL